VFLDIAQFLYIQVEQCERCVYSGEFSPNYLNSFLGTCFVYQLVLDFRPGILENRTKLDFRYDRVFKTIAGIHELRYVQKEMSRFVPEFPEVVPVSLAFDLENRIVTLQNALHGFEIVEEGTYDSQT
jgi:hypothetical protein